MVTVENQQKILRLNLLQLKKIVQSILRYKGILNAELFICFVSRQNIQALNKKYLKRSYATDVLAFDLRDHRRQPLRGDVFISTDAAVKQSKGFGTSVVYEIVLYLVHGILHLLGYDDHSPRDTAKMRKAEQELMKYLAKKIDKVIR